MVELVAFLIALDVSGLGSADYERREAAEARLRAWSFLAVPALMDKCRRSDCQETRIRAGRLLAPWVHTAGNLRAADTLLSPWPVDPLAFWADESLRWRCRRIMEAQGCHQSIWLTPETQDVSFFKWGEDRVRDAVWALEACRRHLGVSRVGWPFN